MNGGAAKAAPFLAILLVLLGSINQGCSSVSSNGAARPATAPARPLADAEDSPEALARRVLAALAAGDERMLSSYRLTKDEFCTYVFPELPASRLNNVTCDFVWSQATLNSLAGLHEILSKHRGRHYELVEVQFRGSDSYESYRVHNKPVLVVRDERGEEHRYRLMGSVLELDGQYKLFGYGVK